LSATDSATDSATRWQELIIDHSQFPRRRGCLEHASHQASGENPLCGDRVRLYLEMDEQGLIRDARFEATGCAISLASASMLAAALPGRSRAQALELFSEVHGLLTGAGWRGAQAPGELEALGLVARFPLRVKCATLSWHVLRQALEGGSTTVTTE
jgi:nitrogen fixation NifU-like protein